MRYTVQYIPLHRIKSRITGEMTKRIRKLRRVARDCMYVMVVRKNKKGSYTLLSGSQHYEYLKKHSRKKSAPCLVDEPKAVTRMYRLISNFRKKDLPYDIPYLRKERISVKSWSIIRKFMKSEPRFLQLSRRQQLKVLRLGLQYKKTTVLSMRAKVEELLKQ